MASDDSDVPASEAAADADGAFDASLPAVDGPADDDVDYSQFEVPGADRSDDVEPVIIESTPEQVAEAVAFFDSAKSEESKEQKRRATKVSTVFSVMQYRAHPETGEVMLTQEQIDEGLEQLRDRLHKWAYVWHDADRLVEVDEGTGETVCVGLKGAHLHMVLWMNGGGGGDNKSRPTVRTVSDALRIPSARVKTPREAVGDGEGHSGRGAAEKSFFDLCEYLPHESRRADAIAGVYQTERSYLVDKHQDGKPGKYQYGRGRVMANFAFGQELDAHMATRRTAAEGGGSAKLSKLFQAVGTGAMTLRAVRDQEPGVYFAKGNLEHFRKLRGNFLAHQDAPEAVMNFYIFGPGGVGKDLLAKTLARALAPDAERAYFKVGGENVSWEGYDGEPVVIWEDMRVGDMIRTAKSRGMLFRILGPWREPDEKPVVNIKNSRTQLLNRVNIVTGPVDYNEFLRGLAGEYEAMQGGVKVKHEAENVGQGYRRFPLIIPVGEREFGIYVNMGFLNRTREYESYEKFERFSQNLEEVRVRCKAIEDEAERLRTLEQIERATVAPILEQHDRLLSPAQGSVTPDDVLAEFASAGQRIIPSEADREAEAAAAEAAREAAEREREEILERQSRQKLRRLEEERERALCTCGASDRIIGFPGHENHADNCVVLSDEEREQRRETAQKKFDEKAQRLRANGFLLTAPTSR